MQVIFSVFYEDIEADKVELLFSYKIETEWNVEQMEKHLELYDLFRSDVVAGQDLCFWDIYLYNDNVQKIALKIKEIPTKEIQIKQKTIKSNFIVAEDFNPSNVDSPRYPNWDRCTIYGCTRFERGASSYFSFLIEIVEHPLTQGIIINFAYDVLKKILAKIFRRKHSVRTEKTKEIYYLSLERFYKNFSRAINMKKSEFQIISLKRLKLGNFKICVRTTTNEYYAVRCTFTGKIRSFNLIDTIGIGE